MRGLDCYLLVGLMALASIGCEGDEGPAGPDEPQVGPATKLVFTVQPGNPTAGATFTPAPKVEVQDASGRVVTSANVPVKLAFGNDPRGATLMGTTTVSTVAGVATFSDLSVQRAGAYALVAVSLSGDLAQPLVPFTIVPAAKTRLGFIVQPSAASTGAVMAPAIQVAVQDPFGNAVTTAADPVTIALSANPSGGTLTGTLTATPTQGLATFSDVRIDRVGNGYLLAASAGALTGATSAAFSITQVSVLTFADVSGGSEHTCALTTAGAAYCWGKNNGRLGDGTVIGRASPVRVAGGLSFTAVSAGGQHSCGVVAGGAVHCWGLSSEGQLGDGTREGGLTPVRVTGGLSFTRMGTGHNHTCGITPANATYCWGFNLNGELGDSTDAFQRNSPTRVAGGVALASLDVGFSHACGLTAVGAAYCWGTSSMGSLGNGSLDEQLAPVRVSGGLTFTILSAGGSHTCGITTPGATYCWGNGSAGKLGDGGTSNKHVPVQVLGGHAFVRVSAGLSHSCGLTASGAAHCWGSNQNGQLGDGTTTNRTSPVTVTGGLAFTRLSAGGYQTCGVTAAGALYCWGGNRDGQLGDGSMTDRAAPVQVVQ